VTILKIPPLGGTGCYVTQKVVPIPRPKLLNPAVAHAGSIEQPKPFRFPVTWGTLLAFPQPVDITETISTAVVVAAPVVVVPVHALQVVEPPPRPSMDEAAWEMVVPKMVRR
jgi:hypothetical protein